MRHLASCWPIDEGFYPNQCFGQQKRYVYTAIDAVKRRIEAELDWAFRTRRGQCTSGLATIEWRT